MICIWCCCVGGFRFVSSCVGEFCVVSGGVRGCLVVSGGVRWCVVVGSVNWCLIFSITPTKWSKCFFWQMFSQMYLPWDWGWSTFSTNYSIYGSFHKIRDLSTLLPWKSSCYILYSYRLIHFYNQQNELLITCVRLCGRRTRYPKSHFLPTFFFAHRYVFNVIPFFWPSDT